VEAGARRKLTGWQGKLHAALLEQGLTFIADAVEHSEVSEAAGELRFVAAKEFTLALKSSELQQAVQKLASRPMKVSVTVGEAVAAPSESQLQAGEDEAERRSLAHPEVQLFQQMFPGSQVRVVRNLKQ
jgi:hypothetical protein